MNQTLHNELRYVFGPNGWLVQRGGYHLNEQMSYALSMADWLNGDANHPVSLVEGDTGTGKTLGYLFPIILNWVRTQEKCVIATHTVALQKQLLENDLQLVEDYLIDKELPLPRIQQRLGMHHYVDPKRVANLAEGMPDHPEINNFLEWAIKSAKSGSGLIDEWLQLYGPLPHEVSESMVCITQGSEENSNQAYDNHKCTSKTADIVLTSHMMVLLEAKSGRSILKLEDGEFHHLLFDEADQVPSTASQLSNRRIQLGEVAKVLERVIGKGSRQLDKQVRNTIVEIKALNQELRDFAKDNNLTELTLDTQRASTSKANKILAQLDAQCRWVSGIIKRAKISKAKHADGLVHETQEMLNWIANFHAADKADKYGIHALSWSPIRQIPALVHQKGNPSFFVGHLWRSMGLRVCFTSATLGTGSGKGAVDPFMALKATMGVARKEVGVEAQLAPKNFGKLDIILAERDLPKPLHLHEDGEIRINTEWLAYVATMITAASQSGSTLVLAASYSEAIEIGKKIHSLNPIVHRPGTSLEVAIEQFKNGNSQILITPAGWQGISIRAEDGGQLIRQLVIPRIPFLPPNVTQERLAIAIAKKAERITPSQARNHEINNRRTQALIKLRQGIGRGIRSSSDEVTLWLADPRFPLPGTTSPNTFFCRAIPIRFLGAYERAEIFQRSGTTVASRKEKSAILMEFLDL